MKDRLQKHVEENAIVAVSDPETGDSICRRSGFEGIVPLNEIEKRIGDALRQAREKTGLIHADVATMLDLHPQVYGRYERGESRLTVTRLVQLSELLDFSPLDIVLAAAPHRLGDTQAASDQRRQLIKTIETMPDGVISAVLSLIDAIIKAQHPKAQQ
jgi:transcriptional regulator with XRE-family HTH domain